MVINNKLKKRLRNNHFIVNSSICLVLLFIMIIAIVFFSRVNAGNPLLFGEETYYHLNLVQDLASSNSDITNDNFILNDKFDFSQMTPLDVSIYWVSLIGDTIFNYIYLLFPLLGLITLLAFLGLSKRLKINKFENLIFLSLSLLTPAIIYGFTTINNQMLVLCLVICGFFLLTCRTRWLRYLAPFLFILIPLFDLLSAIIVLFLLVAYLLRLEKVKSGEVLKSIGEEVIKLSANITSTLSVSNGQKDKVLSDSKSPRNSNLNDSSRFKELKEIKEQIIGHPIRLSVFSVIVMMFVSGFYYNKGFPAVILLSQGFWSNIISDLGAISGISLFVLVLVLIQLLFFFKKKDQTIFLLIFVVSLIGYYINSDLIIYLSIISCFLASRLLNYLIVREWSLENLKNYVLLILFVSVLFSSISFINRVDNIAPSGELVRILSGLESYQLDGAKVSIDDSAKFDSGSISIDKKLSEKVLALPHNKYYLSYFTSLDLFIKTTKFKEGFVKKFIRFYDINTNQQNKKETWLRNNSDELSDTNFDGSNYSNGSYDSYSFEDYDTYGVEKELNDFEKLEKKLKSGVPLDSEDIFQIYYYKPLASILKENGIKFILIDETTKSQFEEDTGLRFLLRNENFKLVYSEDKIEVWEFDELVLVNG